MSSNVTPSSLTASERVRQVLKARGRLATAIESLGDTDNLYQAGLTSHASINVMLGLEGEFNIEFPDVLLKRGTFESVVAITSALATLTAG
jgi:acyl carrier protein